MIIISHCPHRLSDAWMPTITKTGKYISSKEDMNNIDKLNGKISKLKNKVTNLTCKHHN